nr:amidohydrolase family protein [Salsipaludibacter albus]
MHVHVMPDRLQESVWNWFDALEDPVWPIRFRTDAPTRLAHLAETGVVAHTALAYAHRPGMLGWLNDHTLAMAEAHPQVVPTFTIYPDDDVDEQVTRALDRGGRVCKVHTQVGHYHLSDPRLATTWERLADAGVLVLAHVTVVYGVEGGDEWCGIDTLADLLDRHPDLRVVVAHLGMPELDDTLALARQAPDTVLLDPSMALHDGEHLQQSFSSAQLRALADRWEQLVFGSDFPSIPHDLAAQLRGLDRLALAPHQWRAILHHTPTPHLTPP